MSYADHASQERAEVYAKNMTLDALREARTNAARRGDHQLADELHQAVQIRSGRQNEVVEKSGQLYAHHHPPSPENGWRGSTTFTGDNLSWMAPFMAPGIGCVVNTDLHRGALAPGAEITQAVRVGAGERVQVIGRDGKVRAP